MSYIKFREVPEPFEKRLAIAENPDVKYLEPNCYGTAFFLLGVLPYDVCVYTNKNHIERVLDNLQENSEVQDNSAVLFFMEKKISEKRILIPEHAVYILTENPFKAVNRNGRYLFSVKSLEEVNRSLDYPDLERDRIRKKYTLPRLGQADYDIKTRNLALIAREIVEGYSPSG